MPDHYLKVSYKCSNSHSAVKFFPNTRSALFDGVVSSISEQPRTNITKDATAITNASLSASRAPANPKPYSSFCTTLRATAVLRIEAVATLGEQEHCLCWPWRSAPGKRSGECRMSPAVSFEKSKKAAGPSWKAIAASMRSSSRQCPGTLHSRSG